MEDEVSAVPDEGTVEPDYIKREAVQGEHNLS
jgi:hypothetical protein